MDCRSFRKFVGAFADGELEVSQSLDALEHLNMCPSCTRRVEEVNGLREAMKRIYGEESAPPGLRRDVLFALDAEVDASATIKLDRHPLARWRRSRLFVPLGIAAGLVLAATMWQFLPTGSSPSPGQITVVAGRAVADVREQHRRCLIEHRYDHHDESLTLYLPEIAKRLSQRLRMKVIAPDLSREGFVLVGADDCGIRGRPGAHVLYRAESNDVALSLFSVARMGDLGAAANTACAERRCFVSTEDALTVAAWHEGAETYAMCAAVAEETLLGMVDEIRTAGLPRPELVWHNGPTVAVAGW